jgi:hypothetical protein
MGGYDNDVWYSSDGANWIQATNSAGWSSRDGHTSVVHDNKMWVIGGDYLNDVWYSGMPLQIPEGTQSWWVTAFDRAGNFRRSTETFAVRVDTIYPTVPTLISPSDSAIINDSVVIFKWHRAFDIPSGVFGYRLQVLAFPYLEPYLDTIIHDTTAMFQLVDSSYGWRVYAIDSGGNRSAWTDIRTFTFHSVGIEESNLPLSALHLSLKVYPNPAKSDVRVRFTLPVTGKVVLRLYDISGRAVKTLVNEIKQRGAYSLTLNSLTHNSPTLSAGVYCIRLQVDNKKSLISRLVIAK